MKFIFKKDLPAQAGKGFTIIELIISIFILTVAVVAIFNAFSIVTILTSDSADRLTATYLAQEGMEIVRNIRDTNWLNMDAGVSGATWVDGLNMGACSSTGCEADYASTTSLLGKSGDYLYLNTDGFYGYDNSVTKTKFQRKIIITCLPNNDCTNITNYIMKVKVQVFWDEKANILDSNPSSHPEKYSITAEGTLYNWYYPLH